SSNKRKLFFIYPVCHTIDNLILYSIGSYLRNLTTLKILDIDIVLKNVCYLRGIGRERRFLNFPFRNQIQLLRFDIIHIIFTQSGSSKYGFNFRSQNKFRFILTESVRSKM